MKKVWASVMLSGALLFGIGYAVPGFGQSSTSVDQQASTALEGYWQTFDDSTGKPKSIVKIFLYEGQYYGRLVQIHFSPGKGPGEVCEQCRGSRHNQPVLGMVIMANMVKDLDEANQWSGGYVVDPKSGNQYHLQLSLTDGGQQLKVLGYMGSSLFGRTQTWQRVSKEVLTTAPADTVASGSDLAALKRQL